MTSDAGEQKVAEPEVPAHVIEAFETRYRALFDLSRDDHEWRNTWRYKHDHIQSLWEGWRESYLARRSPAPTEAGGISEEMVEALKPFAAVADAYSDREDDWFETWRDCHEPAVKAASALVHFRRARAALEAALSHTVRGVGIKPLEWPDLSKAGRHNSRGGLLDYTISVSMGDMQPHVYWWARWHDGWHGPFNLPDEAKAAAQADYESRIRSALAPSEHAEVVATEPVLPCDVPLPPATVLRAGVRLSTLIAALEARGMARPPGFAEAIEAAAKVCEDTADEPLRTQNQQNALRATAVRIRSLTEAQPQ